MTFDKGSHPDDRKTSNMVPGDKTSRSFLRSALWWLRVAQIRFRFLIMAMIAAAILSQWATLQSLWDRWLWNSSSAQTASGVSGEHEFFCPMDPGVLSAWPAICSVCNMDLVPRRKSDAQILPEGVVARMQLSPYRIQLAGIRTVTVTKASELHYDLSWTGTLRPLVSDKADGQQIGFDIVLSAGDVTMFRTPRPATVSLREIPNRSSRATVTLLSSESGSTAGLVSARVLLDNPESLPSGSSVNVDIIIPAADVLASDVSSDSKQSEREVVSVPESALIDRGREHLVYVESMPGVFDGVAVTVGRRMGAYYPVLSGLSIGQRVASSGAFLIDAEARLNPSLAAGYFGASQPALTSASAMSPVAPITKKSKKSPADVLSPDDQKIVDLQKICPVTELSLDSMGGPVPVMIGDRKVFICCAGCEARLLAEPDKYLARLRESK